MSLGLTSNDTDESIEMKYFVKENLINRKFYIRAAQRADIKKKFGVKAFTTQIVLQLDPVVNYEYSLVLVERSFLNLQRK